MSEQTRVTSLAIFAGTNPTEILTRAWEQGGREHAVLRLGSGVTLHVDDASPEWLRALATAAAELADWCEGQAAAEAGGRGE
jgi:hypothetical protein